MNTQRNLRTRHWAWQCLFSQNVFGEKGRESGLQKSATLCKKRYQRVWERIVRGHSYFRTRAKKFLQKSAEFGYEKASSVVFNQNYQALRLEKSA
ncbi:Hypothetical protein HPV225_0514 [Helicobacter pylori v225d]|nr:Hypothetical protein HPV225_0514 [Helicobacter pylori v225d]